MNRPNWNVNRPIIGGGNNVNINRPIVGIGTRPGVGWGIDPGFSRPHWNNYWNDHCVNYHHHGWYHGCWNGHWSNNWFVPFAVGTTAWSYYGLTSNWGYGPSYYNPYYVAPVANVVAPYDYSQPVVINNYIPAETDPASEPQPVADTPEVKVALTTFDEARAAFKTGDFGGALKLVNQALLKDPNDSVMHEFRALCHFALGEYKEAAAALNSLLASAPGMDWTTMSGLYGDIDDYTKQLRQLEDWADAHPKDSAAEFVLAYHYLVLGHIEEAIASLKRVVELEPKDMTARRMLDGLLPPKPGKEADPAPTTEKEAAAAETDLVGSWKAMAGMSVIELTIGEDFSFTWKATTEGKPTKELKGTVVASADSLSLETEKEGNMAGQVESGGADMFHFKIGGFPPDDPGLEFKRIK